ncbi:MAG: hypothetical protein ACREAY_00840 [Nitrososphaera sp.]|uniref:hypothetical protein n=1 Tax=Nitrososphaera sp. TaxID=1971748 RepID=UPI003D6FFD5C
MSETGMRTITFKDEGEKARAFYELIHSKAQFQGIDKNTLILSRKDCQTLKKKHIKYYEIG